MVILTHILKSSLSNSSTSLTIFIEDNNFTGLGRLFWLNSVKSLSVPKHILISDQSFIPLVVSLSPVLIFPPNKLDESYLKTSEILCIDSLEYLI